MIEWGIKWQYPTQELYDEAVSVASKAVAGFDYICEPEELRISFRTVQNEERFTIAYSRRNYKELR